MHIILVKFILYVTENAREHKVSKSGMILENFKYFCFTDKNTDKLLQNSKLP